MRRPTALTLTTLLLALAAPAVLAQEPPRPDKKADKPPVGEAEDEPGESPAGSGDEAANQPLPWNPFEKAVEGDWASFSGAIHVETSPGGKVEKTDNPIASYWKITKVDADSVTVESTGSGVGGKRAQKTEKTFSRKTAPTIKALFELEKEGKVEHLKVEDDKLTIEDKEFAGKKVSFTSTKGGGKMKTAMWLSPGVKGIGLVKMLFGAKSADKGGDSTKVRVEIHIAGYGNGDKTEWGKSYKELSKDEAGGDDGAATPARGKDASKGPGPGEGGPGKPEKPKSKLCATCGEPRPVDAETCPHCGQK